MLKQSQHNLNDRKKSRNYLLAVSTLALALAASAWLPSSVSARQGSDDTTTSGSTSTSTPKPPVPAPTEDSHNSGSGSGRNTTEPVHTSGNSSGNESGQTEIEVEHAANQVKTDAEHSAQEAKTKADSIRTKLEDGSGKKLDDSRLKACQKREIGIDAIMSRIGDRSQKQLDLYSTISTRVQTFVTDKKLTVPNYDQMLADINAKKAAAQAAVDKVKADKANFKCDGTDPIGSGDLFKADTLAQNEALKAYRASIKVLLVAVKTAAKAAAPTPTPAPAPVTGGTQ